MTLCNRVTPFNVIIRTDTRGAFMGNRGIIHDPATRSLHPTRRWTHKAWIICLCAFKGRRRKVMGEAGYTELFFLDEATALATGHRPCFECRRTDAEAFRSAWPARHGLPAPRAPEMDAVLHAERLDGRSKRLHRLPAPLEELPDGVVLAADVRALLVLDGKPWTWAPHGYTRCDRWPEGLSMLTPPSTFGAIAAGYRPQIDPSALTA